MHEQKRSKKEQSQIKERALTDAYSILVYNIKASLPCARLVNSYVTLCNNLLGLIVIPNN
jgi:hypothetical protein